MNFYRRFIKGYLGITALFIDLIRKDRPFTWEKKRISRFYKIKATIYKSSHIGNIRSGITYNIKNRRIRLRDRSMHYIIKKRKKTLPFRLLFQKNITSRAKLRYLR
jgi:hypothetical protein